MSLQFITGAGNKNHQQAIIELASEWLADSQHEVFFLVPNYNKFEREQELLSQLKKQQQQTNFTSIRSQVYSFNRLAWYFLQRTGQSGGKLISDVGASMVMRKVLESVADQLTIFRGELNKTGFIAQLLALYKELQVGNVHLSQLQFTDTTSKEKDFRLKMEEFQVIFAAYEEELLARQVQIEQPIPMLTRYLMEEHEPTFDLSNVRFIVSGFSNFSAQEQALLQVLMSKSQLCIDLYMDNTQETTALDLFYEAKQTYGQLKGYAQSHHIPVRFDYKAPQLEVSEGYLALEKSWRLEKNSAPKSTNLADFVDLWKAETPEEELRQIAVEIRRIVAESSQSERPIRYRDIQLLTLDPTIYYSLIPIVFDELEIPYYLDESRKMEQHPLVEFIHALFALDNYYYRLTDVFRFLRTELYIPAELQTEGDWTKGRDIFRKYVDITENKALAHHFHGNDWIRETDWQLIEYNFEEDELTDTVSLNEQTNQVRRAFRRDIVSFFKTLKKASDTKTAVQLFYDFLIEKGIEQQLICWRNQEIERGNLEQGRNHEQTWAALMDVLDEYVEIYGEEPFDFQLFEEILISGLENLTFGKIPTAIDQVKINPLSLARPLQAKITFAIGLDETTFPRKVENKSLLSTEEREQLNELLSEEQYVRDQVTQTLRNEPFVAYNLLLSASQHLYLSYAANYDTQQNIKPSPYLERIRRWSNLAVQNRQGLTLQSPPEQHLGTYRSLIRQLNNLYRQMDEEKTTLPLIWQQLSNALHHSQFHELATKVFDSQTHKNEPVSLSKETAIALYGKDIHSSISRMETFHQCEYKYFASYGLRLQERDVYGLNPAITGEFFHDALDRFMRVIIEENISLLELSTEARESFVERVLQEIFGDIRYDLLNRSARMNFIRYQLAKTIQRVTWALQKQSEKTHLSPVQTEVLFGQIAGNLGISGLELPLETGGKLHVRGKIDRVDMAMVDDQPWLSVVDYKSSSRDFDLTEAYYGLAMQLITYLDVALTDAIELIGRPDAKIAGAYYFHVHNPLLDQQNASENERLKQFKYDGLFVDDASVFPIYDDSLEKSKNSILFPIRKDKNEQLQKVSQSKKKFYTEDEIHLLRMHNRRKMTEGGNKILSGEIELNPSYKMKDKKRACQFCPFRSICNFDVMLKENDYHRIENLSKEQIIERMREEEND
ncbi:PD-(D/E)XK nuclease family protein [Candidatus Enterococcus willemsii]|uniref:ATP-dependent helicase/deoxyribonuclease subunit B n=1 Tax=Candidatus Enterococcus willemsii TaxID=1857215 RepID=A0ABQ6YY13_9ENTE|nr:PD-(D/E)XK nuclease family protein [Enterococcus sp. CU12B]KAF1302909.1 ATP-dependent helicase [Enterococcus sp. CU12B]